MTKRNKRIIKKASMLLVYILIIGSIFLICINLKTKTLKRIGYSDKEISIINKLSKDEINTIKNYKYDKNIIDLITDSEYKKENLDQYLKLITRYDNVKGIIKYINNFKDTKELSSTLLNILSAKYFIDSYLDDYIEYYNNNLDLSIDDVILRVNTNIRYDFYTHTKEADTSKGMYTLVNKYNYLTSDYVPEDLVRISYDYTTNDTSVVSIAYENFLKMVEGARKDGFELRAATCYRGYSFQRSLYNNYVNSDGVAAADTYSARPGFSEHQLGYSLDLTNGNYVPFEQFENTGEYTWLKDNAHKYGFIIRFPKDKEYITGYMFESWHVRYVGVDVATYIYENDITYEEYYAYFIR